MSAASSAASSLSSAANSGQLLDKTSVASSLASSVGSNKVATSNHTTSPACHAQTRCYLCEIPKHTYALVDSFSEPVCRGCINFEGPDSIEALISSARCLKNNNHTPASTFESVAKRVKTNNSSTLASILTHTDSNPNYGMIGDFGQRRQSLTSTQPRHAETPNAYQTIPTNNSANSKSLAISWTHQPVQSSMPLKNLGLGLYSPRYQTVGSPVLAAAATNDQSTTNSIRAKISPEHVQAITANHAPVPIMMTNPQFESLTQVMQRDPTGIYGQTRLAMQNSQQTLQGAYTSDTNLLNYEQMARNKMFMAAAAASLRQFTANKINQPSQYYNVNGTANQFSFDPQAAAAAAAMAAAYCMPNQQYNLHTPGIQRPSQPVSVTSIANNQIPPQQPANTVDPQRTYELKLRSLLDSDASRQKRQTISSVSSSPGHDSQDANHDSALIVGEITRQKQTQIIADSFQEKNSVRISGDPIRGSEFATNHQKAAHNSNPRPTSPQAYRCDLSSPMRRSNYTMVDTMQPSKKQQVAANGMSAQNPVAKKRYNGGAIDNTNDDLTIVTAKLHENDSSPQLTISRRGSRRDETDTYLQPEYSIKHQRVEQPTQSMSARSQPMSSSLALANADNIEMNETKLSDRQHQSNQTNGIAKDSLFSSIKCLECNELLQDRHFVQCPTVQNHKFCFGCSRRSIAQQRLAGRSSKSGEEKIFCPSGKKCLLANECSAWTFMANEIETIFKEADGSISNAAVPKASQTNALMNGEKHANRQAQTQSIA